jgi:hypothetical protein
VAVSPELEQIVAEVRPIAGEIARQLVAEELDRLDYANRPGSLSSAALEAADRSRPAGGKKPHRRHPEPAEPGAGTHTPGEEGGENELGEVNEDPLIRVVGDPLIRAVARRLPRRDGESLPLPRAEARQKQELHAVQLPQTDP